MRRLRRRLLVPPLLALLLVACEAAGAGVIVETATPRAETSTPGPALTPTPAGPTATPFPTLTPVPAQPPATPTPAAGLSLKPPQIEQGGVAIVYLNLQATSATVRFQERQYPMLNDGSRWWAIVGVGAFTAPGIYPISVAYNPPGSSQTATVTGSISVLDKDFPVAHITLDPTTAALLAPEIVQAELAQRASIYSGYTMQRFWSGPFVRPSGSVNTSLYGEGRSYNGAPVTDYHKGTDFAGSTGEPIVAAAAGRVVFTGELKVRGNSVIIDHGAGVFTAYHHLSRIDVVQGQMVSAGQQIGLMGATGLVTGPHLHWEVVVRGVEVNGEAWLKGSEIGP